MTSLNHLRIWLMTPLKIFLSRILNFLAAWFLTPYMTRPTPVAYMGLLTTSTRPLMPLGFPIRTGRLNMDSAISLIPSKRAVPPVMTMPEFMIFSIPARYISLWMREKISSIRGSRISPRICLGSFLGSRPPIPGTSMVSSLLILLEEQVP